MVPVSQTWASLQARGSLPLSASVCVRGGQGVLRDCLAPTSAIPGHWSCLRAPAITVLPGAGRPWAAPEPVGREWRHLWTLSAGLSYSFLFHCLFCCTEPRLHPST